jgi:hypothetical protein
VGKVDAQPLTAQRGHPIGPIESGERLTSDTEP